MIGKLFITLWQKMIFNAPVAQLEEATDLESVKCWFKSSQEYFLFKKSKNTLYLYYENT